MDHLRLGLLLLHLLGFAALLGGLLAQVRGPLRRVDALVRDGAWTAVAAGLVLAVVVGREGNPPDGWHTVIAVKSAVGLAILGLVLEGRRRGRLPVALWATLLGLTLLELAVAVFGTPVRVPS